MHRVFFGLEFNHEYKNPEAVVWPSVRPLRVTNWVHDFQPRVVVSADGKEVVRERVAVEMPFGFRLRKDEVEGLQKKMKLESYQDAKFYVVMNNAKAVAKHPASIEMERLEKLRAQEAAEDPKPAEVPVEAIGEPVGGAEDGPLAETFGDAPVVEGSVEGELGITL